MVKERVRKQKQVSVKKGKLPKKICVNDITLFKVSLKNDNNILNELLELYTKNKKHLLYWHHEWKELLFKNIIGIKKHLTKKKLICYVIYYFDKIIGCLEISKLYTDNEKFKCRDLSYWIDKSSVKKGIMYKCLNLFEKIFIEQKLNALTADIDAENIPSIKLVEKLNFKRFSASFVISADAKTACHFYTYKKILCNTKIKH